MLGYNRRYYSFYKLFLQTIANVNIPDVRGSKGLFLKLWNGRVFFCLFLQPFVNAEKVDACTIMRDTSGTSKGFAFLTFENPSAADAVIGRQHVLDGKSVCLSQFSFFR